MNDSLPFELLDDPQELAKLQSWDVGIYRDLVACREGTMTEEAFSEKYLHTTAILILDMTGFTETTMRAGALAGFLRILDAQRVCAPVLRAHGPDHMRAFADDMYANFSDPGRTLDAALEIHCRVRLFNQSGHGTASPAECCIGLGYGPVFRIGPDFAMGDEMNRASKLGEDTANGHETLVTEQFFQQVRRREDCIFEPRGKGELPFAYYAVAAKS